MPFKKQIKLKTAVLLPFVIIFSVTFGVIAFVQKANYEQMVQDISSKQLTYLTNNVEQRLYNFLEEPFLANLSLSHNLGFSHLFQKGDTQKIEDFFRFNFSQIYKSIPQIDSAGFGGINAEYVGFRKENDHNYTLMVQDKRTQNKLVIYQNDIISNNIRTVIENYDPRERPWYVPVAEHHKPMWSSIYTNADERQEITLSSLSPVFQDKQFVGVSVTDVKIDTFNAFLREMKLQTEADVYIFDHEHRLVAHSSAGGVVSWGTSLSPKGTRLMATENASPVIKASAEHFKQLDVPTSIATKNFVTYVNSDRYFNKVTPFEDEFGLHWFIGVSISEPKLLGEMPYNQRNAWYIGLLISMLGIGIGYIAFNRITAPITSTAAAAQHLARGDWATPMPKSGNIYETSLLVHAFNEMANNLKASFKALRTQLVYDSLTKLYSREGLVESCSNLKKLNGCLFLIGIDKFRDINDSLGHQLADQLLIAIAQRLKNIYASDAYIARIGGDEFALYLPLVKDEQEIQDEANRILQLFATPYSMPNEPIAVNVSIGIVHNSDSTNMTVWLRNGSIALSNAKSDSTRISYYAPEMAGISRKRTQMVTLLKVAIEKHEFVPFYQPIVDLNSGEVLGAEALARWISPELGLVPPTEFIPVAEESGLINTIGEQILLQACIDTVKGIEEGKWACDFRMHVNLSVSQLSSYLFLPQLEEMLRITKLSPSNLALEITESKIVDNDPIILSNMLALKKLGIHIAIDDFGTGYSSLSYLHKLPFDCLKIDRAFVTQLNHDHLEESIVAAIINMMKGFKVQLVAEGIETQEQVDLLHQLNCPQGQGFLFSKPIPYQEWPTNLVNMRQKTAN
ncbi:EAL domain-containing protein [Vibrio diazotrophicus]|jgi:diguanylate cyclase (GGDEF)-like protein|uniref:EAL domain-containing protein n=1 Tax=Vibrio diazotrophicus TaxID=685 RepID=UPI003D2F5946